MAEENKAQPRRVISVEERTVLAKARDRTQICEDSLRDIYEEARDDLRFRSGEQWNLKLKQERESKMRPCLVVNKLPSFSRQITNDHKQNRPNVKFRPVDSDSDVETAEVIGGIMRHIWSNSDGDAALDTAEWYAVNCSIGYMRILTQYVTSKSFDQEIRIDRVKDPFSVLFPVHLCKKADYSDMPYAFIINSEYPKADFEEKYPDVDLADYPAEARHMSSWVTKDVVRVAEYYEIVYSTKSICELPDGSIVDAGDVPAGVEPLRKRGVRVPKVLWRLLCGVAILEGGIEGQEIPTVTNEYAYIPIAVVTGEDYIVDGKQIIESINRNAKDPQMSLNYWETAKTEALALATKTPYIGYEGQFEGHEAEWASANRENFPYLEVKPTSLDGKPLPLPQRVAPPPIPTGFAEAAREANENLKQVTGIFDASLGSQGNEKSGIAIRERKQQGSISNYHYTDNLVRTLRHVGRIIGAMIPTIYDTARILHIIGEENEDKIVRINEEYQGAKNEGHLYDMTAGQYDVVVDVGPSYATQRQETAEMLLKFSQNNPIVNEVASDLVMKSLDVSFATEIADRLRKMIEGKYPNLFEDEDGKEINPAMIRQLQQQNEQMQKVIKELDDVIQKMQGEIDSKDKDREANMDKALLDNETKIQIAELKAAVDRLKIAQDADSERLKALSERAPEPAPPAE